MNESLAMLAGTPGDPASFAPLDELLEAQAYRLCFWRVASDEINYRRFFDINDLAALTTEREDVFLAIHRTWLGWVAAGLADGLRIDHPDGLFDPKQYLERLQERVSRAGPRPQRTTLRGSGEDTRRRRGVTGRLDLRRHHRLRVHSRGQWSPHRPEGRRAADRVLPPVHRPR